MIASFSAVLQRRKEREPAKSWQHIDDVKCRTLAPARQDAEPARKQGAIFVHQLIDMLMSSSGSCVNAVTP